MQARGERTEAADARLRTLLADALKAEDLTFPPRVAVVALGGYGRGELAAGSDLDVLLVHDPAFGNIAGVAERLWYPLWDEGIRLDHTVRTIAECRSAAASDLRTALSSLDARHVAGDGGITLSLRASMLADWRLAARRRLVDLEAGCRERAERFGELAGLLEPDLKQAKGGLRDGVVLRALAATWLVDVPHALLARVHADLLDIRDALHDVTGGSGRNPDRLLADTRDEVAAALGLPDADALLRRTYQAGRTLAHLSDVTWRRVAQALDVRRSSSRDGPTLRARRFTPLGPGVRDLGTADGEVVLAPDAPVGRDPVLLPRAAFEAASRGLLLSPYACARLATSYVPLPDPWPAEARRLWTGFLGAGRDLIPVWEALDQAGLIEPLLPEWPAIRCAPQWSSAHTYTLDRHLLQTCVEAAALVRRVSRPDLLVVAALLHDLGKGAEGHESGESAHSVVGAGLVRRIAPAWGFSEADTAILAKLVRHHLLLIESATRRDLDDPSTIKQVAVAVEDADTLDLLAALTEADARATGPAAWTPWRAGLLERLVELVRARLVRGEAPAPAPLEPWQAELAERGETDVVVSPPNADGADPWADPWADPDAVRVTVVAPDRVGSLATVAGVLATGRLGVRSASVQTVEDARGTPVGISVWSVSGDPPEASVLRDRLIAALAGGLDLADRLSSADRAYGDQPGAARMAPAAPPSVRVLPGVSSTATVLEVRAHDQPGLFYRICVALADAGASVRSAHVSTLANEAVDVVYLTTPEGAQLPASRAELVRRSVDDALTAQAASGHPPESLD